jgi:Family of unknown function (DUF6644)
MLTLARWLSETPLSNAIRAIDWIVPLLQTIHILAIAMVVSSLLLIDLRVLQIVKSQTIADTTHRFEGWIWAGLGVLAASGVPLIVAEPRRTLPNASFQIKLALLALAITATYVLCSSLRRNGKLKEPSASAGPAARFLAVGAFMLWCAVATAGRFIAYTQPN